MPPKTYTVKQVADILGYSTNSIYTFLKEKRIKGVRVGKGRFRIPQSELDRLLATDAKSQKAAQETAPITPVAMRQGDDVMFEAEPARYAHIVLWGTQIQLPNIFEWFVGASAILSGIGLFLFNTSGPRSMGTQGIAGILPMVRIVLIAGGLGVLLASMYHKEGSPWRRIFHGILSVMGFVNAFLLWRGGDVDAAVIYGGLALLIGLTMFVHIGGIAAATLYIAFILVFGPIASLLVHYGISTAPVIATVPLPFPTNFIVFTVGSVFALVCIIYGYQRKNWVYLLGTWTAAVGIFAAAFLLAQVNYWSRSFFFVTIALTAMFLPIWRRVQYEGSRREKAITHAMFAVVSIILAGAILSVGIMQGQAWKYHEEEFANKREYGSILVDTVFASAESVLLAAASNPELIEGMKREDTKILNETARVIYEGNEYIRRVVMLDAQGDGLLLYPPGAFERQNFAFREYFTAVRDSGKPYVSNLFQAQDGTGRHVVGVAVPVLDKKTKAFAGALVGSVDLDRLANRLQQVAIEEREEFFVVADARGVILIHPDRTRVNQQLPEGDKALAALEGKEDVVEGAVLAGRIGMLAYGPVPSLGWSVSLRAPAKSVHEINQSSYFTVFGAIAASILIACLFCAFIWTKDREGPTKV